MATALAFVKYKLCDYCSHVCLEAGQRLLPVRTEVQMPPSPRPWKGTIESVQDGTSLAVQGLGLRTFTAEGPGSIPGWGTEMPQASWPKEIKKNKIK